MKEKKTFRETTFGKLLTEKLPDALAVVGDILPDQGVFGVAKNIIDRSTLDEKEKRDLLSAAKEFELTELKFYLEDLKDARNREVMINQVDNGSWLSKNITALLALSWSVIGAVLIGLILSGIFNTDKSSEAQIIQGVFSVVTLVLAYYFGSSQKGNSEFNILKSEPHDNSITQRR